MIDQIQPDRITIEETYTETIRATGAKLHVTVKGSSFFTGQAALKKAKEVAQMVETLKSVGVTEEDISLESVSAHVESGLLSKSSSARYGLKITCGNLETLPDVMGAVTGAKNATLDQLEWDYGDLVDKRTEWIQEVLKRCNAKAATVAGALNTKLVGIHNCNIQNIGYETPWSPPAYPMMESRMKMATVAVDMGMPMVQASERGVQAIVEYKVAN
jgi:uncharacterized protein YggE